MFTAIPKDTVTKTFTTQEEGEEGEEETKFT